MGLLAFLGCILLFFSDAHASEDDIIANDASGIPDPKLYQEILQEVAGYGRETFTKREAERLKSLCIFEGGLKDLTGIGYLCNLEELYIEDKWDSGAHTFTSLKPLQDLKELQELFIDRNWSLKSLEGIGGLTRLRRLSVTRTSLDSLEGIEGLTQLEELCADNGKLSGLSGIEALKGLKILFLRHNRLTDVKELRHLKKLTELYIDGNRLTDIGAVKDLKHINVLSAPGNRLTRLPKLKWSPYETLDFRGNRLSERELNVRLKKLCRESDKFTVAGNRLRGKITSKSRLTKSWLKDQIMFQDIYGIRLTSPGSFKRISKDTRRIAGRIKRSGPYRGEIYVSVNDERARSQNSHVRVDAGGRIIPTKGKGIGAVKTSLVRVQPDGAFVIDKAMARKDRGGWAIDTLPRQWKKASELFFEIYLYSEESKCLECVKSVLITEKDDYNIGYNWEGED